MADLKCQNGDLVASEYGDLVLCDKLRPLQIGRDWSLAMANDTPKKRAKEAAKYNSLIFSS